MSEFAPFPKLPRLNRGMVISEKIDGTNSAVVIAEAADSPWENEPIAVVDTGSASYALWAQSRKRLIFPGKERDNFGFAGWVKDHAEELARLGPGHHFGEWWGHGIQRGYGLDEKRFSLFNTGRWEDARRADDPEAKATAPTCCHVVPILDRANFSQDRIDDALERLRCDGSAAAPGFMNPEGVVVYLSAARQMFKVTLDHDGVPKSTLKAYYQALDASAENAAR